MILRADLHLHTTASDGPLAPAEVVELACARMLEAIAITDHDTTAGLPAAQAAARGRLLVLPGIELSAEAGGQDVHVLGYLLEADDPTFQAQLAGFRDDRLTRGQRIVERLAALGSPVAWERVLALADGGAVGRPHIALALVEAGHVASVDEAFRRYLYTGGPAYVGRERLSPAAAVALIQGARGVAVLAHPGLVAGYAPLVEQLAAAGLDGVEVVHPHNPPAVRENLRALARRYDLVMTGGSDFHRPDEDVLGEQTLPPGCVEALQARAAARR